VHAAGLAGDRCDAKVHRGDGGHGAAVDGSVACQKGRKGRRAYVIEHAGIVKKEEVLF
jgi:hypothetical protein